MARIDHLQDLLSAENTNNSIITLDNFIGELCDYGDNMEVLTEPQKMFYINQNLEREVNNGGFNQYFINSSGDYAHETIVSLETIGAYTTAGILLKAIEQFPLGKVPKNRDERINVVEQIEDQANESWDAFDKQFFKYADDLNALNMAYIKKNQAFF